MRASPALLLALAAGAALLLAAPAAAQTTCPPGCSACEPYTDAEIAAWKAKKAAKVEAYKAKKEAKPEGAVNGKRGDGKWRGEGKWGGEGKWNGTKLKCTACESDNYERDGGKCKCKPGFGMPLPKIDGAKPPARPAKTCEPCPERTASGPNAPKIDWKAFKAEMKAKYGSREAFKATRNLLADMGAGGKMKKWGAAICVPCPADQTANKERSECA